MSSLFGRVEFEFPRELAPENRPAADRGVQGQDDGQRLAGRRMVGLEGWWGLKRRAKLDWFDFPDGDAEKKKGLSG